MFQKSAALGLILLIASMQSVLSQGSTVAFGSMTLDTTLPVEVSASSLTVDQTDGSAQFDGDVIISQGGMRLSANSVDIRYDAAGSKISQLRATGNVLLVSGADAAEADRADYDVDRGVIVLSGNALMAQGNNALTADRMTIDLVSGRANMEGRVRTILEPAAR